MRLFAFALVAAVGATSTARADYVFDTFNVPTPGDFAQIDLGNTGATSYTGPSYAIGSPVGGNVSRTVAAQVTTPPPSFPTNLAQATIVAGGGVVSMFTADTSKANLTLTYSLSGAARNLSAANGLILDFSAFNAGNSSLTTAATNIPLTVTIATSTGTRTRTLNITGDTTVNIGGTWTGWSGSGSLADVNSISFVLNGGTNSRFATDFTLDSITVKGPNPVPAPAGVLLVLAAAPVLALRRRWNRTAAAA